jgi:hypothetical protein
MRHTNWRRNLIQSIQPWTQARKIIASHSLRETVKRLGYTSVSSEVPDFSSNHCVPNAPSINVHQGCS